MDPTNEPSAYCSSKTCKILIKENEYILHANHSLTIIPTILRNDFFFKSFLGSGSDGDFFLVYEKSNISASQDVFVLKLILNYGTDFEQIAKEATIFKDSTHKNLIRVKRIIRIEGDHFIGILSEFYKDTLKSRLKDLEKKMTRKEIIDFSMQINDVLLYLHTLTPENIVYCGIKLKNIFLEDQTIKLDFPLSKFAPKRDLKYSPPELKKVIQKKFKEVYSEKMDFYSFGVVLRKMIASSILPKEGQYDEIIDRGLDNLAEDMLQKEQELRPDAQEIKRVLEDLDFKLRRDEEKKGDDDTVFMKLNTPLKAPKTDEENKVNKNATPKNIANKNENQLISKMIINREKYVYEGQTFENKRHGHGKCHYSNGSVYEGSWNYDKMEGFGSLKIPKEGIYQGEFMDNVFSGEGAFIYENGDVYKGKWANNKKEGYGTMEFANGESYLGEWKDGLQNGKGLFRYVNGDLYQGNFLNGSNEGQSGKYTTLLDKFDK